MIDFDMCALCRQEYNDPQDRRFYSQTNCCPHCGPKLQLLDINSNAMAKENEALQMTVDMLLQGKIVAIKNTGGYQLLVDATQDDAVMELRRRKRRPSKPFAVLMPCLNSIDQIAQLCQTAIETLTNTSRPIVLLPKKKNNSLTISPSVSKDSPYWGMMLPHSPLQHLLMHYLDRPLVATSGNFSGNALCINEQEALSQLSTIADAFLVHNRRIHHRLDDSVVHIIANKPVMLRRARGYIPYAITLPQGYTLPSQSVIFASGSQQKSSFAFAKTNRLYLSQYIGDLESANTCQVYAQEIVKWEKLLAITPTKAIADKHAGFFSHQYLQHRKLPYTILQHHQAHVLSGMIDNQLSPPFLAISWDGTGWGEDGTIWGGEAFSATSAGMQRVASLYPFKLPGNHKAIREPRRSSLGILFEIFGKSLSTSPNEWLKQHFSSQDLQNLLKALENNIQAPLCSSVGRLFDAASALLSACTFSDFDGQAALKLESLALAANDKKHLYRLAVYKHDDLWLCDWRDMMMQVLEDVQKGLCPNEIAWAFHAALSDSVVDLAKKMALPCILLTGGVMQNKLLVELTVEKLTLHGFLTYIHHNIPPNDGGIAAGQIMGEFIGK